jgi:hypothetical protein
VLAIERNRKRTKERQETREGGKVSRFLTCDRPSGKGKVVPVLD